MQFYRNIKSLYLIINKITFGTNTDHMKIKNEDELDKFIICHKCFTLHKKVPIKYGNKALCSHCNNMLYKSNPNLAQKGLALSITSLIFLLLANRFPVVSIDILSQEQYLTIIKTFFTLFESGFYIVGFIVMFLIFIFPFMTTILYIIIFSLLFFKVGKKVSKNILILISHIKPWSMSEIFLVSILVALVKLIGYAQIHIGISFSALVIYVLIDIYIESTIKLSEIWMYRDRVFNDRD